MVVSITDVIRKNAVSLTQDRFTRSLNIELRKADIATSKIEEVMDKIKELITSLEKSQLPLREGQGDKFIGKLKWHLGHKHQISDEEKQNAIVDIASKMMRDTRYRSDIAEIRKENIEELEEKKASEISWSDYYRAVEAGVIMDALKNLKDSLDEALGQSQEEARLKEYFSKNPQAKRTVEEIVDLMGIPKPVCGSWED